jgi:probable F420-dependent oxidoreductase
MQFWHATVFAEVDQLVEGAAMIEEHGFDGIAVSDHLVFPQTVQSKYPYTSDGRPWWSGEGQWPDPWVLVGAMAAVTTRVRFTTNVYVLPLRDVFTTAKSVGTAAVLSGGRVALGIGAGWMREEFDLVGQPFARRGARMEEQVEILHRLWAGGMVEHHGEFHDFEPVQMSPTPPGPIPVWVGGTTDLALRRAATVGDGWIGVNTPVEVLVETAQRLVTEREKAGKSLDNFEIIGAIDDPPTVENVHRLEDAGVTGLFASAWLYAKSDVSTVAGKREALEKFAHRWLEPLR